MINIDRPNRTPIFQWFPVAHSFDIRHYWFRFTQTFPVCLAKKGSGYFIGHGALLFINAEKNSTYGWKIYSSHEFTRVKFTRRCASSTRALFFPSPKDKVAIGCIWDWLASKAALKFNEIQHFPAFKWNYSPVLHELSIVGYELFAHRIKKLRRTVSLQIVILFFRGTFWICVYLWEELDLKSNIRTRGSAEMKKKRWRKNNNE